jgi:hypothetical protein
MVLSCVYCDKVCRNSGALAMHQRYCKAKPAEYPLYAGNVDAEDSHMYDAFKTAQAQVRARIMNPLVIFLTLYYIHHTY